MRTRRHATALLVGLALLLAACGGGSSDAGGSSDGGSGSDTTAPKDGGSDSGSDSGSKGDVDCEEIKTASQQLLSVQLLAQLNSPDNVAAVKEGTVGTFDPDEFLAGMETLHQLDGYSGPLGDPGPAIDAYEDAATQAKALLDADPPTQEAIDAYMESIGTTGEFLGHQVAISGALDEAGC